METIEENSNHGSSDSMSPQSQKELRICLIGEVAKDQHVIDAANLLSPNELIKGPPDHINEAKYLTFFVLKDFEGSIFEEVHKTRQCVLGPPALKELSKKPNNLMANARPLYNYSMRGVVTCFTGIRKKDELTRLVTLIHAMGGCIRKDMNSKITHLISNHSSGEKYKYAKTFRLTVVRPDWVYAAWERRDEMDFLATTEPFSQEYKLKPFEGQKICFFGFPTDEHQHMVDVLLTNGGITTGLEDPECSHVVMPKNVGYLPETEISDKAKTIASTVHGGGIVDGGDVSEAVDDAAIVDKDDESSKRSELERIALTYESDSETDDKFDNDNVDDDIDGIVLENEEDKRIFQMNISYISPIFAGSNSDVSSIISTKKQSKFLRTGSIAKKIRDSMNVVADNTPFLRSKRHQRQHHLSVYTDVQDTDSINETAISNASMAMFYGNVHPQGLNDTSSQSKQFENLKKTPIARILRPRKKPDVNELEISAKKVSGCKVRPARKRRYSEESDFSQIDNHDESTPKTHFLRPRRFAAAAVTATARLLRKPRLRLHSNPPKTEPLNNLVKRVRTDSYDNGSTTPKIKPFKMVNKTLSFDDTPTTLTKTSSAIAASAASETTATITNATNTNLNSTSTVASSPFFVQENHIAQETSSRSKTQRFVLKKVNNESTNNISGTETVVDEHSTQIKPNPANVNTHILKSDWFWYTIQNGYADETDYLFGDYLDSIANTPDTDRRESLPISLNKRKRKRFSQRLQFEGSPLGIGKRRSSISDALYASFSDSFLDCTTSPDASKIYVVEPSESTSSDQTAQTPANRSLRFYHFMDFVNTESNYVGILDTIVTLFKNPLEKMYEDGDALLNPTEIKSIFGDFLSIHAVHQSILQRLRVIQNNWAEDCLIGDIILELKDDLIRSYPPYINFFESMKEMLASCDHQNPRFHAFLKINQTKPECGRQSLQDLMIRPVQRLPSISLLLNDILKHTAKSNPDYAKLEEALKTIKEVMTYINEDKRKTESRVAIFDIFNDIDGCPAHLVSSNRCFVSKCEVVELSDELSGRGDSLVFYLFSDTIEVCKKRSRGFNAAKSPGSAQKPFKHVKLLPLNAIRFVIDIVDSLRAFALLCRQDKDKLYSFTIVDEEIDKIVYIKTLCKQMAQHACRADAEKSLISRTSQELDVDISNVNLSTLSKAFKLAARTRLKVGRAFSFNKTPAKLKRAVSTMMTSPFGSTNALALTPASQLAQMRLASCTNIHEASNEEGSSKRSSSPPMVLEPPLSVQPERKNKSSNLNSLGRL